MFRQEVFHEVSVRFSRLFVTQINATQASAKRIILISSAENSSSSIRVLAKVIPQTRIAKIAAAQPLFMSLIIRYRYVNFVRNRNLLTQCQGLYVFDKLFLKIKGMIFIGDDSSICTGKNWMIRL